MAKNKFKCNLGLCQPKVRMKFFRGHFQRTNPLSNPTTGAFLPAITVCRQQLCPEFEPVTITIGGFSTGFSSGFRVVRRY